MNSKETFNSYANNYHLTLNKTLSISGENTSFFANARVNWIKRKIEKLSLKQNFHTIMDFGCGTGDTIPILNNVFKPKHLIGVDISDKSIEIAIQNHGSEKVKFLVYENSNEISNVNLIYCNGVFHHIPPEGRKDAICQVHKSLSKNGFWAFWENNPWNMGTQYITKKSPFDSDAKMLSPIESIRLLKQNGFKIIDVSYYFIFPRALKHLRFMEKYLSPIPLGAQYLILAKK